MKAMYYVFVCLLCGLSACQVAELEDEVKQKVMVFQTELVTEQETLSRSAMADYITTLNVYDYLDGELANEWQQTSTETGFGSLGVTADYGTHTFVFVGHKSTSISYDHDASLLTFDKVTDTFTAVKELTVGEDTESNQAVAMVRQVGAVKVVALDAVPMTAHKITITVEGYSEKLDPSTGKGNAGVKHVREWEYADDAKGQKETSCKLYTFVTNNAMEVKVSVSVTDADGKVLGSATIENVAIEKNRCTILSGELFSSEYDYTVSLDGEWDTDIEMDF